MEDGVVDLSDSVAMKTVEFDRPITGQQLVDAVEKACEATNSSMFREQVLDEDIMYLVGRHGRWSDADNLLVTPNKTSAAIELGATYGSAVVVRHDRPVAGRMYDESGPYTRDQEIQSVRTFADELAQAVRRLQEPGLEKGLNPAGPAIVTSNPATGADVASDWRRRDGSATRSRADGPRAR
jgi:hypothetical protein